MDTGRFEDIPFSWRAHTVRSSGRKSRHGEDRKTRRWLLSFFPSGPSERGRERERESDRSAFLLPIVSLEERQNVSGNLAGVVAPCTVRIILTINRGSADREWPIAMGRDMEMRHDVN